MGNPFTRETCGPSTLAASRLSVLGRQHHDRNQSRRALLVAGVPGVGGSRALSGGARHIRQTATSRANTGSPTGKARSRPPATEAATWEEVDAPLLPRVAPTATTQPSPFAGSATRGRQWRHGSFRPNQTRRASRHRDKARAASRRPRPILHDLIPSGPLILDSVVRPSGPLSSVRYTACFQECKAIVVLLSTVDQMDKRTTRGGRLQTTFPHTRARWQSPRQLNDQIALLPDCHTMI